MKALKAAVMVASLGWAVASSMPVQAQTVGYNIRTGDVWVDARLGEINDYGRRYRDPFVSEMTGHYGAPRSLVLDLLDRRGWSPADVYFACAIARALGIPCLDVVQRYERNPGVGWGNLAKQMGIVGLDDPDRWMVPSFALGVASVSPLEMAEAYATFAARGLHCTSRPVTAIEDMAGNTLKEYPAKCRQVMQNSTADAVNDVLRGVIEPGGFASSWALEQPSAGKTGTTQDGKSVWFVGYTPNMAAAAMIAGANQSGTPVSLTGQTVGPNFISSASGSGFAAPIWGTAMRAVQGQLPDQDFVAPSASDIAGVPTTVPGVSGTSVESATQQLEAAGFVVSYGGYVDSAVAEGLVAYSSPGTGAIVPSRLSSPITT